MEAGIVGGKEAGLAGEGLSLRFAAARIFVQHPIIRVVLIEFSAA